MNHNSILQNGVFFLLRLQIYSKKILMLKNEQINIMNLVYVCLVSWEIYFWTGKKILDVGKNDDSNQELWTKIPEPRSWLVLESLNLSLFVA